jgi:hypothetical protein
MARFVVLTVEGSGFKGTFAGASPDHLSEEEAFTWAWPLALTEIPYPARDGAVVLHCRIGADVQEWGH